MFGFKQRFFHTQTETYLPTHILRLKYIYHATATNYTKTIVTRYYSELHTNRVLCPLKQHRMRGARISMCLGSLSKPIANVFVLFYVNPLCDSAPKNKLMQTKQNSRAWVIQTMRSPLGYNRTEVMRIVEREIDILNRNNRCIHVGNNNNISMLSPQIGNFYFKALLSFITKLLFLSASGNHHDNYFD